MAQVTEHASWIESEQSWEETYQVKYYFSTSPPPQSTRALRPFVSSPPIPIPGTSPSTQPGAENGAIPQETASLLRKVSHRQLKEH